jgi:hypothetical protein
MDHKRHLIRAHIEEISVSCTNTFKRGADEFLEYLSSRTVLKFPSYFSYHGDSIEPCAKFRKSRPFGVDRKVFTHNDLTLYVRELEEEFNMRDNNPC